MFPLEPYYSDNVFCGNALKQAKSLSLQLTLTPSLARLPVILELIPRLIFLLLFVVPCGQVLICLHSLNRVIYNYLWVNQQSEICTF